MAWVAPRTWSVGEHVTAAMMNQDFRDNQGVLKTNICDLGWPKTGLKTFAYSAGQANAFATTWEEMTSFRVSIPGGFFSEPGDTLAIEGQYLQAANANNKYFSLSIDNVPTRFNVGLTANATYTCAFFYVLIRYKTATTGDCTGVCMYSGTGFPVAALAWEFVAVGLTADWANTRDLKFWFYAGAAADMTMTDVMVNQWRTGTGEGLTI